MRISFIAIIIAFVHFCSCKTQQLPLESYNGPVVTFGNRGGFAGTETAYKILKDGRVYAKAARDRDFALLSTMDDRVIAQLFSSFQDLGILDIQLNDPGNLTYFIHIDRPGKLDKQFLWGAELQKVDPRLKSLYMHMLKMMKPSNPTEKQDK